MQFYIVAGGQGVSGQDRTGKGIILASTEILKMGWGHSWQRAKSLPSARTYFSGVSLDNGKFLVTGEVVKNTNHSIPELSCLFCTLTILQSMLTFVAILCVTYSEDSINVIFITGGHNGRWSSAEVLVYDSRANQWTKVGQLAKARRGHAMTKVPKDIANYCR